MNGTHIDEILGEEDLENLQVYGTIICMNTSFNSEVHHINKPCSPELEA